MIFIENIFVCLVGTLIIAALIARGKSRPNFMFVAVGMGSCLLSAYINTFFAVFYGADRLAASVEIAPVCEELLKLLPLLFYVLIFEPKSEDACNAMIAINVGFATFENVSYLTQNNTATLTLLLFRGFGVSAMHLTAGLIVGYGLFYVWRDPRLKFAGTLGLLSTAITFHAIFNMLVSMTGPIQVFGYMLPVLAIIAFVLLERKVYQVAA